MTSPAVTFIGTKTLPIADLRPHPDNPNHGDIDAIAESLGEFGQYRSIVALADGRILAGHHVVKALQQRGETEVRVDVIDTDEQTAKRIMLADNRLPELGDGLDPEQLLAVLDSLDGELAGTGYDDDYLAELADILDEEPTTDGGGDSGGSDTLYTTEVNIPHYTPQGDTPPPLTDCIDRTRTRELEQQILAADLDEDLSEFLLAAAQRHTVIDFHKVADYYAHAPAPVQRLMEDQALVIVDMQNAIRNGYVRLSEQMRDLLDEEYPER